MALSVVELAEMEGGKSTIGLLITLIQVALFSLSVGDATRIFAHLALYLATRMFGSGTFHSSVFLLLGAKVPTENFRSRERKFSVGTFAPRSKNTEELKVLLPHVRLALQLAKYPLTLSKLAFYPCPTYNYRIRSAQAQLRYRRTPCAFGVRCTF